MMSDNFCPSCRNSNLNGQLACPVCGTLLSPDEFDPNHLRPGTLLKGNQYEITKTLGQGGFAITYKAVDLANNSRFVAVKELWPERSGRDGIRGIKVKWSAKIPPQNRQEQIQKFRDEAEKLKKLANFNHPSIVKVYDDFEENNTIYIVMEFINGKTLLEILKEEGVLSETRIKRYFLQLSYALKKIHGNNILHRDIKPDNIIINQHDRAVLIDFGAAREFIAGSSKNMTRILTPGYAPPEQYEYRANRYPNADIYSLCASMYHLLTDQLPVSGSERKDTQIDPLIPPRQLSSQISPLMERIILTGMKRKAEERFTNADHLIEAFNGNFMSPLFIQARNLVIDGDLAAAVPLYQRCVREEPDNSQAAVENALILTFMADPQAKTAVYHARGFQPQDGRLYGVLGLLFCRESNWLEAIQQLQKGVNLIPDQSWVWANLAWAIAKSGKLKESLTAVDKAIAIDQTADFALSLKAWITGNLQQWRSTVDLAKQVIRNSPSANFPANFQNITNLQTWVYPCLIIALDRTSNKSELTKYLQEYSNQFPDSAFAYGFNAYLQATQGNWDRAEVGFKLGIARSQSHFWMLLNLGISYEYLRKLPEAIQTYKNCYDLQPQNSFVLFRLGTVLSQEAQRLDQQNSWLEARHFLELAVKEKPDYAEAYHNLAWVLHHIRNNHGLIEHPAEILRTYRRAVELYEQQNQSGLAQQIRQAFQVLGVQL